MASTDARPIPIKNTAFRVYFDIRDVNGDLVSGAAGLDSEVSKDGGAFADCTNEATEIGSTGVYYLDFTSGEMNADCSVAQVKTSTTDAKTTILVFYPQEAGDIKVDMETIKTQSVTCGAGVTVLASVGTAATSTAQTGDTYALANSGTHGFAALKTLIDAVDDLIDTEVAAIKAKTDNLPSDPADASEIATATSAIIGYIDTEVAAIKAKTDNLPADPADASDIAGLFTTLTNKLTKYVQLIVRKDAAIATDNATELTAINVDGGSGAGAFDNTTDSQQAIRDSGDLTYAIVNDGTNGNAAIKTLLATVATYVDTEVAAIKAKTDNLPSDPADASDIAGSFSSVSSTLSTIAAYIDTEVAAIKAKTDNLPAAPAAIGDIPSAAAIASQVRTELTTELGRIDAAVTTRSEASTALSTVQWTNTRAAYLDNLSAGAVAQASALSTAQSGITAIQAKTDALPASPAAAGDIPSAATVAAAVRTELATELARIDAAISTRSTVTALSTAQTGITTLLAGVTIATGGITTSSFAAGAINAAAVAADTSTEIVAALFASDVFGGTFKQVIAAAGSAAVGKLTDGGTGEETLYAFDGTTTIAVVTVDNETGDRVPDLYPS